MREAVTISYVSHLLPSPLGLSNDLNTSICLLHFFQPSLWGLLFRAHLGYGYTSHAGAISFLPTPHLPHAPLSAPRKPSLQHRSGLPDLYFYSPFPLQHRPFPTSTSLAPAVIFPDMAPFPIQPPAAICSETFLFFYQAKAFPDPYG